jgi:hypothetical protein
VETLVYFSRFGILYEDKSGNSAAKANSMKRLATISNLKPATAALGLALLQYYNFYTTDPIFLDDSVPHENDLLMHQPRYN